MRSILFLAVILAVAWQAPAATSEPRSGSISLAEIISVDTAAEESDNRYTTPDPCSLEVVECRGEKMDKDAIERLIRETFPEDPDTAVAIAHCESRLDPTQVGDKHTEYYSYGVFQIRLLPGRVKYAGLTAKKLLDPRENIAYARKIYDRFGWKPWTCAKYVRKS